MPKQRFARIDVVPRAEILALSVRSRVQLDWLVQKEGLAACKTVAFFQAGEAFEHPSPVWNYVLRSARPCLNLYREF